MKKYKKIIVALSISSVILGIAQIIYNKNIKDKEIEIKIITENVYKGENIPNEIIKKVKIKNNNSLNGYSNVDVSGKVANRNIAAGKILEKDDVTEKENENIQDEKYEYITIEVKNISDGLAYQLKKGDTVNLYYTVKDKQINNIEQNADVKNGIENVKTIKIIEKAEVVGVFDTSGASVEEKGTYSAIMFRVTSEQAITISNIKGEGNFSVTLVK